MSNATQTDANRACIERSVEIDATPADIFASILEDMRAGADAAGR